MSLNATVQNLTAPSTEESFAPPEEDTYSLCFLGIWGYIVLIILIALAVFVIMYIIRKIIQGPHYTRKTRIDGKVVIVTGCNTGIGKETAMELARRGGKVYMACRDAARCEAARLEIIDRTQNTQVFNRTLDLSSLSSVRQFASRFLAEEQRLDILINNAGIMATPRKLTVDGFEQQFGVNHLGHFLLTNLLLDRLKYSSPSRIINLSSAAYIFGKINRGDLNSEKKYSKFFGAYSQSKLANILFTKKLAEKLEGTGVTVNCCHPGVVRTELNRYNEFPGWFDSTIKFLSLYFFRSPVAGAQTSLRLALDERLEKATGGFYMNMIRMPTLPKANDKETAEWLWKESEKLVGLPVSTDTETVIVNGSAN